MPENNAYTDGYVCPSVRTSYLELRTGFHMCNIYYSLDAKYSLKFKLLWQRITTWRTEGREGGSYTSATKETRLQW